MRWYPSTCACIIDDYNTRDEIQKQKCRSHDTVKECRDYNHTKPPESDRTKPQYQRR